MNEVAQNVDINTTQHNEGAQPSIEPKDVTKPQPKEGAGGNDSVKKDDDRPDSELTPEELLARENKKLKNALSRKSKNLAKIQAQLRQMEELRKTATQQTQTEQPQSLAGNAPREEDFDTYGEYLRAKAEHNVLQKLEKMGVLQQQTQNQTQQPQMAQEQQQALIKRQQEVVQMAQEATKQLPDYQEVYQENAEILNYLPQYVSDMMFYETDNPALVFYNLAKSGMLAEMLEMSPTRVAMEIARAQNMPVSKAIPQQAQSRTPAPIRGAKGAGTSSPLTAKIGNDIEATRKWLKNIK